MSYGSPKPGVRKAGGGMFLIVVLVIGAFLFFSNRGNDAQNGSPERTNQSGYSPGDVLGSKNRDDESLRKEIFGGGDFDGSLVPANSSNSSSDWQLDDVATKKDDSSKSPSTTPSDWSMDDIKTKSGDNQFNFSNPKPGDPKNPGTGGDWSLEDGGTQTKKTEKGDWSLNDGGTNPKKGN